MSARSPSRWRFRRRRRRAVASIRADRGAIRTTVAQCAADAEEVIEDDHGAFAAALCKLRAAHVRSRARLLAAMNRLIDVYADHTNHEHAQRLPATMQALQAVVANASVRSSRSSGVTTSIARRALKRT